MIIRQTTAQLSAMSGSAGELALVTDLGRTYFYISDATTLTRLGGSLATAGNSILATADGSDSRWVDTSIKHMAKAHRSTDQTGITSLTNYTMNTAILDPFELFDSSNNRFVTKRAGWYNGRIVLLYGANSGTSLIARFTVATVLTAFGRLITGSAPNTLVAEATFWADAGAAIVGEVQCVGGTATVTSGTQSSFFEIVEI